MKKIAFYSFGCRTNKEEIDTLASQFRAGGFEIIYNEKDFSAADFIIVNTCSVTLTAESKNYRFINSLAKKYPQAKIVATGCLAQQNPEKFAENVDFVVGNAEKGGIFEIIINNKSGIFAGKIDENTKLSLPKTIENPQNSDRTRFSIKIQEGCNSFCSYCIVPYLRGKPRSADFDEIITHAKNAIDLGYNEIVLTGTHIGQFADSGKTYIALAEKIISFSPNIRLRLSSMNPNDCDEKLFEFMLKNEQICRHLHIAVQSLSPKILIAMNRNPKSMEQLFENLQKYRKFLPSLNLGGDFIVGFPGETDENFAETIENIKKFGFNYGHVFTYSQRPQTPAAEMQNQIDEKTKKSRSEILRNLFVEQKQKFAERQIGGNEKIIIETDGELDGLTGNYLRVSGGKNPKYRKNQIVEVELTKYDAGKNYFIV